MALDESDFFRGLARNTALSPAVGGYTNVQDAIAGVIAAEPVAPTDSHAATAAFTQVAFGTPLQNTAAYAILVTLTAVVTSATTATFSLGVGPTSTPTTDVVVPSFTTAAQAIVSYSAVVPAGYYLSTTHAGTIVVGTPQSVVTPL